MNVIVFLPNITRAEIENNLWTTHTDVTCSQCGKIQSYTTYCENNECKRCNYKEEAPILVIGKAPMVLNNSQEVNAVLEKLESIIVASQMLDYEKPSYNMVLNNKPFIRLRFRSQSQDKLISVLFNLDKYGKYVSSILRINSYYLEKKCIESESNDIFYILDELQRVI